MQEWYAVQRVRVAAVVLFALLLSLGCTKIQLIGKYDETTDQGVTALHRRVTSFLYEVERGGPEAMAYSDRAAAFYDSIHVDLDVLQMRAQAMEKNDITVQQLDLLEDTFDTLEELHREGLAPNDLPPIRNAIDQSCGAILKLERAKLRGQ